MKRLSGFIKKLLATMASAVLVLGVALPIAASGNNAVQASALDYDASKWLTAGGEAVEADENGSISLTQNSAYYTENLGDKLKLDKNGVLTVTVEFSARGIPLPTNKAHAIWFIAPTANDWLDMTGGEVFMPDGSNTKTLGARMYFQSDDQVQQGRVLFRCCDYKNYRTADRFYGFNKDYTGKHELSWTITEEGVTMYMDGNALRADSNNGNQPTYWPEKSAGERWTLNDFLDEEGNPSVYFGFGSGGFAETLTVHSVGNGLDYVQAGGYEGVKGALTVEEDVIRLTDGNARTIETNDLSKTLTGKFEIEEVPAYVYDGLNDAEQVSTPKTAFTVDVCDGAEVGYGFRIAWKPLMSTGNEKTEIEFGYLTPNGYTAYSSCVVPSIAVGSHTFAFSAGDGYAKLIADGVSEYISYGLSNDLWELSENIKTDQMYAVYTADSKYNDEYTGKWLVRLYEIAESEASDWVLVGDTEVTGEQTTGTVEYDYRLYPTVASNQTVSVNSAATDVAAFGYAPIKLYSKIDLNLQMTVKATQIPSYQTEEDGSFILLSFSNVLGGITNWDTTANAFLVKLSWVDEATLSVAAKMGMETKKTTVTVVAGEDIKVEFGWAEDDSVIKINGETQLTGSVKKGHFGSVSGVQGYFAMRAYNGSEAEDAKWEFTVEAPCHVEAEPPVEEEPTTPPEGETPTTPNEELKGGCGGVIGGLSVAALAAACIVVLTKKREEN